VSKNLRFRGIHAAYEGNRGFIEVQMNSPVDLKGIDPFVEIEPALKHAFDSHGSNLRIIGDFEPGQRYRVVLKEGLPAGAAGTLEKEITRAVWFSDKPKSLNFAFDGGYLSPQGLLKVPLRSINVEEAKLSIRRLYDTNIVEYVLRSDDSDPAILATDLLEHQVSLEGERNEETETLVDLKSLLKGDPRGVYGLTVRASDKYWRRDRAVIVVTDLGLSARLSKDHALVWATSISTARPASGIQVVIYSDHRQKMGEGTTDINGLAEMRLKPLPAGEEAALVIAQGDDELSYLNLSRSSRSRGSAASSGRPYLSQGYEVFASVERGVYRPGDKVLLSALIRGVRWETPESFPLDIVVGKPRGGQLLKLTKMGDRTGRILVDFEVPQSAPTGRYPVSFHLPGKGESLGEASFLVADYVPHTLRMVLEAPPDPLPVSRPFEIKAHVEHLFGESASGLTVSYRERLAGVPFKIEVPRFKTRAAVQAEIEVEVLEPGGRALSEQIIRRLDPWDFYLGVERPVVSVPVGAPCAFQLAGVTPAGKALAGQKHFKASLYRITYSNVLRRSNDGRYEYEWTRHEKLVTASEGSLEEGRAAPLLTPEHPGQHRMVVECERGCPVTLDFHVIGPGASWAVEDPEELQLKLDKKQYRPGDVAKLFVSAPFGGTALICVESDRVLDRRVVEIVDGEGTQEFVVDAGWRPNVYITATLIRPVEPEDDWKPHRASGVVRLDVDCGDRRLDITVESPPTARPDREIEIAFHVTSGGQPVPDAALIVAAVDEGVLALTRFSTPAPWDFFYAARRLGVREFDMFSRLAPELNRWKTGKQPKAGGGGRRAEEGPGEMDLTRRLSPIQVKRVKTVVLYEGRLVTDSSGTARAAFKIPGYLGELRIMAMAAADNRFCSVYQPLPIKSPLMFRASWPRFLAPDDEFEIPVTIFNKTKQDGEVKLALSLEGPIQVARELPGSVPVPAGEERTAFVHLRATGIGKAAGRITVSLGGEEYSESVELPVRPPASFSRHGETVMIDGGKDAQITVGGDFFPGTAKCSVVLAGSPLVELTGVLHDLLRYPYGCVEQTVSKLVPLVYLSDLAGMMDPETVGEDEIDELMRLGFLRLRMMQTYSGGLASWIGQSEAYPWGSLYAADLLVEARKAGHEVPEDLLDSLLDYANTHLNSWAREKDDHGQVSRFGEAAYACYVLARAGKPSHTWMASLEEILRESREQEYFLPVSGRFHLAAAYMTLGESAAAKEFIADARSLVEERQSGGYLNSPTREAAIMLSILLDVDPESDQIPALADRLRKGVRVGAWGTTQENAFVLMALGKYARRLGPPPNADITVTMPDGSARTFQAKEGLHVEDLSPGQSITARLNGEGKVYAFWRAEGVPRAGGVKEEDSGFSIRRAFCDIHGNQVAPNELKQGQLYQVRLVITADRSIQNIVISDLLPAGLEIENTALEGSARLGARDETRWLSVDHLERRDDRLLLFVHVQGGEQSEFRYTVRAVTAGTFTLPAVEASCMYDPGLYSVHGRGEITVQ
jgi:uncharacterized protein YfaS (alpha-2-macroglobulin family)